MAQPYRPSSQDYQPTHPELFKVDFAEGSFASCLKAVKPFKSGETICAIHGSVPGPKQYSTVQVSPAEHIELQSDLLYCNHSCDPNVAFVVDGPQEDWHVEAVRDIEVGDILTFAYFTTEWDMDQPFDCLCRSSKCLGRIGGAKDMPPSVLDRYRTSEHIKQLKHEQALQRA